MSKREQFDAIYNSFKNGQKRQTIKLMLAIESDLALLMDYLENDLRQPFIAIDLAKLYFNRFAFGVR